MSEVLRLGFTGTQGGMTFRQKKALVKYLKKWSSEFDSLEIHHGDCIGADAEFHEISIEVWDRMLGKKLAVVVHPPLNPSKRAFCEYDGDITILPEKDYIPRNHDIVDSVEQMLASPKTEQEELRSGTWATIRYSRKQKVKGNLLRP